MQGLAWRGAWNRFGLRYHRRFRISAFDIASYYPTHLTCAVKRCSMNIYMLPISLFLRPIHKEKKKRIRIPAQHQYHPMPSHIPLIKGIVGYCSRLQTLPSSNSELAANTRFSKGYSNCPCSCPPAFSHALTDDVGSVNSSGR